MNKFISIFLLIFLVSFKTNHITPTNNSITQNEIKVDFRNTVETLTILQDLWVNNEDGWPYGDIKNPVKEDIKVYFEKFKDHKAVAMTKDIANSKLSFSGPILIALRLTDFPNAKPLFDLSYVYQNVKDSKADGEIFITEYLKQVNDFYNIAEVGKFLESHKYYYQKAKEEINNNIPDQNSIKILESFYGKKMANYYFIYSLTNFPMAFGHIIDNKNKTNAYEVCAVLHDIDETKHFYGFNDKKDIVRQSFHEYGHSFVNLKRFQNEVSKSKFLYDSIKKQMTKIGYSDWQNALEEHIVRAIEIRLWKTALKNNQYAEKLKTEHIRYLGFKYIPFINEQLAVYEKNRTKYRTFDQFIPKLLDNLKDKK